MTTLPDFLARKRDKLTELRATLSDPEVPPVDLEVTASIAGGSGVRPVQVREFTIVTDSGPVLAGYNLGPSSPELLLSGLASCLAHTFLIVGVAHEITFDQLSVAVRGKIDYRGMLEMDPERPVQLYDLGYAAHIVSEASDEQLERVRQDVDRLCPVLQTIVQPGTIEGAWQRADF